MSFLGLDLGTTGVKCTITDDQGKFLSSSYREYLIASPQDGFSVLDPNMVWEKTKEVIYEANKDMNHNILGLSISSFGESFVLIDDDGNPLMESMVYTDIRGTEEVKSILQKIPEEQLVHKTGLRINHSFSLPKLLWIKNNQPHIFSKINKILPIASFIYYKLGGNYVTDYALAARTYLFNVHEKIWDRDLMEVLGIPLSVLPSLVPMGSLVGLISTEVVDELGLNIDVLLVMGSHDQVCCAIGSGICEDGDVMDGMGTVDCVTPLFKLENVNVAELVSQGFAIVPYSEELYTTYAYIYDGGALVKWYTDLFLKSLRIEAIQQKADVFELLSERMPKEPTELLVLPHFSGSATPYQDSQSRGIIQGLTLHTNEYSLYKAILEGIAFEMKMNLQVLESNGVNIKRIIASGGGSQSDEWLQIKANIYQIPVCQLKIKEAGTMGVILLAGVATGMMGSIDQARKNLIQIKKVFYPEEEQIIHYQQKYKKYHHMYSLQKKIMEEG